LRQNIPPKQRKALATKIGEVLKEDMRMLSKEMQEILADDLVTAFLNRLDVLTRMNSNRPGSDLMIQCSNDTFQLIRSRHGQT
jgi:hypothetical protein